MTNKNSGEVNPYADKIFTISNILSLSRIVIVIPIIYFLDLGNTNPSHNLTALALMIIGGLTDTFDGQLARKMNQITNSAALYIKKKYAYLFTSNMLGKITITVVALMVTAYVVKDVFRIEEFYIFLLWISTMLLLTSFYVYILRLRQFLLSQKK